MDGRTGTAGRRRALALSALIATTMAAAASPATAQDYDAFAKVLDQARVASGTPSLSAVVLRDGAIVWEGYFGTSDDEGETPTDAGTTYSIASVTKPMAATAIVAESLAGQLSLDTPMSADPGWADTCAWLSTSKITFGAGGTDPHGETIAPMDCNRSLTLGQMLDMRANGDRFVYNPISFARIDRAITGAGGRDLRTIVRERVANPAGMQDTALGWRDPDGGAALRLIAPPFRRTEEGPRLNAFSDDDFRAAAGIKTSARGIAAFDVALDKGALLPPALIAEKIIGADPGPRGDYRLGWWVQDWQGHRMIWHSGWDEDRYSAIYLKVPGKRLTLILLANTDMLWWENSLIRAEIDRSPIVRQFLEAFVAAEGTGN